MTDYNEGGLLPGPYDGIRIWTRGVCPLDGYQFIETEPDPPATEPIWEHVIPPTEIPAMVEVLARIADAHGFEVTAGAEEILRARP